MHPFLLSGGQKRRLSVGTALVTGAPVLCLDEPTFGQDRARADELLRLLQDLNREGTTIVVVTHDMQLVAEYAERTVVVDGGCFFYDGSTTEIFTDDALLSSRVAPDGDLEPALDAAHRAGLLRPTEDGWEFASPLLHEAVLASGPRELVTGAVRVPPRRGKKSQLSLVAETREA